MAIAMIIATADAAMYIAVGGCSAIGCVVAVGCASAAWKVVDAEDA